MRKIYKNHDRRNRIIGWLLIIAVVIYLVLCVIYVIKEAAHGGL